MGFFERLNKPKAEVSKVEVEHDEVFSLLTEKVLAKAKSLGIENHPREMAALSAELIIAKNAEEKTPLSVEDITQENPELDAAIENAIKLRMEGAEAAQNVASLVEKSDGTIERGA